MIIGHYLNGQKISPLNQNFSLSKKWGGGAYFSELLIFLQNIDFWAIKWSEEAKNIFWESLEHFLKIPTKFLQNFDSE